MKVNDGGEETLHKQFSCSFIYNCVGIFNVIWTDEMLYILCEWRYFLCFVHEFAHRLAHTYIHTYSYTKNTLIYIYIYIYT